MSFRFLDDKPSHFQTPEPEVDLWKTSYSRMGLGPPRTGLENATQKSRRDFLGGRPGVPVNGPTHPTNSYSKGLNAHFKTIQP